MQKKFFLVRPCQSGDRNLFGPLVNLFVGIVVPSHIDVVKDLKNIFPSSYSLKTRLPSFFSLSLLHSYTHLHRLTSRSLYGNKKVCTNDFDDFIHRQTTFFIAKSDRCKDCHSIEAQTVKTKQKKNSLDICKSTSSERIHFRT